MVTIRFRLLLLVAALSLGLPAGAQLHRGARTVVRGGLLEKPDSLKGRRDSLANDGPRARTRLAHAAGLHGRLGSP